MMTKMIAIIAYIIIAPILGCLLENLDEKLAAKLQHRSAAPFVHPLNVLRRQTGKKQVGHTGVDEKSINQKRTERKSIEDSRFRDFCLAAHLLLTVAGGAIFFWGGDLLLVLFTQLTAMALMIPVIRIVNARAADIELIRIMAVLPMLLLTAAGFFMAHGSFSISDMTGSVHMALLPLPGIFAGCLCAVMILLRKHPFGMGAGLNNGNGMSSWLQFAGWYRTILCLGLMWLFFCNGTVAGIAAGAVISIAVYFLMTLVGSRFGRMTPRAVFRFAWIAAVALGLVNLFELQLIL